MAVLRACVVCAKATPDPYCSEHKPDRGRYRRERMGISGGAWDTIRKQVLTRDSGCCYICGKLGSDEVDHLVPVVEGGGNELTNLASSHHDCHARRHREPEWARERVETVLAMLAPTGAES